MGDSVKKLLTFLFVALLASALAACGDESKQPASTPLATVRRATPLPASSPTPLSAPSVTPIAGPRTSEFTGEDAALFDTSHPLDDQPAPEFSGASGWINTQPFKLEDLRGRVVLIDFWTYTCINCIRTIPFVEHWYERYLDRGLVVIGVHSPEFEFEKKYENVLNATKELRIEYPVVMDNDWAIWKAFSNTAWPGKYVIDVDGVVRQVSIGEGGYIAVEQGIRYYLAQAGYNIEDIPYTPENYVLDPEVVSASMSPDREESRTRELYAGMKRNLPFHRFPPPLPYILYEQFYDNPDTDQMYVDPTAHGNHHIYMQGLWHNYREYLRHAPVTTAYEDYVAIKYNAKTVNVVVGKDKAVPYEVRVTLDGKPVPAAIAEPDIKWDAGGNSYIVVEDSRMYRLIRTVEYEQHELKLSSNSDDFSLFTFTFGYYKDLEDN